MISFLQINLNGNWDAQHLLDQTATEYSTDVLLISEPYSRGKSGDRWCFSTDSKAVICTTPGSTYAHDDKGHGAGFAWMRFGALTAYSCYWRPGSTLAEYSTFLADLDASIRSCRTNQLLVAGDFNAWCTEWGSAVNNARGEMLSDLAGSLGLVLANTGNTPTFVRGTASSIIDVTFAKNVIISDWKVLDDLNLSDHMSITFNLRDPDAQLPPPPAPYPRWNCKKIDLEAFSDYVTNNKPADLSLERGTGNRANEAASRFNSFLHGACVASLPPRSQGPPGKRPVYWWTESISDMRRLALHARRQYQTALRRVGHEQALDAKINYKNSRRALRTEIKKARDKSWADLCDLVDSDPWGKPYRLVMGKFGNSSRLAAKGRELEISEHLFPSAPLISWDEYPSPALHSIFDRFDANYDEVELSCVIPPFTKIELLKATKKLSMGKAGGPNGIPNEILKRTVAAHPSASLAVMNACLEDLVFPETWKKALLVLIHKGPGKPPGDPSSFRPISLLDTPGKLLERMLLQRLECHLDANGGRWRSTNQYGFRKGVSTESAIEAVIKIAQSAAAGSHYNKDLCVLVTLDVKNAFNSLRWPVIDAALRAKKVPEYLVHILRSWLSDRSLLAGDSRVEVPVTCGVPQGSVLGPTLWNIAYDSLLSMDVPQGIHLVGFADDLAVVGVAHTGELLQNLVNPVLEKVDRWMSSKGLQLAHHKSEGVMLTSKNKYAEPALMIGNHHIALKAAIRYLGVILDKRLSFGKHAETVAKKASATAVNLGRLMPNVNGPAQSKRRLLSSVVESQLLYASSIWSEKISSTAKFRAILIRPQRAAALRVIRAYRTVSDDAALLLADMPPADLLALERARVRARRIAGPPPGGPPISLARIKREERKTTLTQWQIRWRSTPKARWTQRLIPNAVRWEGRTVPKVGLTFHMTQALTGHGCFQHYLNKMGRASNPSCMHCPCTSDTVEHTLFDCPHWNTMRECLRERLGRHPNPDDLPDILCGPRFDELPADQAERSEVLSNAEETFRIFYKMVEDLLSSKEEAERLRQAATADR